MKNYAVAIFAYRRPDHLHETLKALAKNKGVEEFDFYFFLDGPRSIDDNTAIERVRQVVLESPFGSTSIIKAEPVNRGLYAAITSGVTHVLSQHEAVVVLEEDIVTASSFLDYMKTGLQLYRNDLDVGSIHGYLPAFSPYVLPETFFLRGADCWGWATWNDRWKYFRSDASALLAEIESKGLTHHFNLLGNYGYTDLLAARAQGHSSSWAICWHASCYLAGMHTLYPGRSLVQNIGLDSSGEHCKPSPIMASVATSEPIQITKIEVREMPAIHATYSAHFLSTKRSSTVRKAGKYMYTIAKKGLLGRLRSTLKAYKNRLLPNHSFKHQSVSILHLTGPYPNYKAALSDSVGYDSSMVLEKVNEGVLAVLNGEAVYERDGTAFAQVPATLPIKNILSTLLKKDDLVVDFGGGLGGLFINHPSLFKDCRRKVVIEQDSFITAGKLLTQNFGLGIEFLDKFSSIEEVPNVIILSSVLSYLPDPMLILNEAVKLRAPAIIIDRTPVSHGDDLIWYVQDNPGYYRDRISYPVSPIPIRFLFESLSDYDLVQTWVNSFDAQSPPHRGYFFRLKQRLPLPKESG